MVRNIFDRVFVINLDKDVDRLTHCSSLLKKCGISFERFPAIHGNSVNLSEISEYISAGTHLSKSEIGCALSHLSLWIHIANNPKIQAALILEDDINIKIDPEKLLDKIEECVTAVKYDIVFLGKCLDDCRKYKKVRPGFYRSFNPLCTHAYILSKKGAQKLLAAVLPLKSAVDIDLQREVRKGNVVAYVFHPSLIYQDVNKFRSNIRGMRDAANNLVECSNTKHDIKILSVISVITMILMLFFLFALIIIYRYIAKF